MFPGCERGGPAPHSPQAQEDIVEDEIHVARGGGGGLLSGLGRHPAVPSLCPVNWKKGKLNRVQS